MAPQDLSSREALNPGAALGRLDRAERLIRWGRAEDAARDFASACEGPLDDDHRLRALLGLAQSLGALGRHANAIEACHQAIAHAPARAEGYAALAGLLLKTGDLCQAMSAAQSACRLVPGKAHAHCLVATIALHQGRASDALGAASEALGAAPSCQEARMLAATAQLLAEGSSPGFDFARLVRRSTPATPTGFRSIASFNHDLSQAILGHDALTPGSAADPLSGGRRLHDLRDLEGVFMHALAAMVLAAAKKHLHRPPHGARIKLRGWANVMAVGGLERPHIHEGAWLSAVYYPRVSSGAGQLLFGPHELGPGIPSPEPVAVAPAEGMLVIFPSYVYHSTAPHPGPGERISVALDVLAG